MPAGGAKIIAKAGLKGTIVHYEAYFDTVDDAKAAHDIDITNDKLSKAIGIKDTTTKSLVKVDKISRAKQVFIKRHKTTAGQFFTLEI